MKRTLLLLMMSVCFCAIGVARNVTLKAVDRPASVVFRSIVSQTGMNFVYSSDLLKLHIFSHLLHHVGRFVVGRFAIVRLAGGAVIINFRLLLAVPAAPFLLGGWGHSHRAAYCILDAACHKIADMSHQPWCNPWPADYHN